MFAPIRSKQTPLLLALCLLWLVLPVAAALPGTVTAWGDNRSGQTVVPNGLINVTAIAAGAIHSLVLKSDGTVAAWGDNSWGQATVPVGLSGVKAIAAGESHSLALKSNGTVVAWGKSNTGQLTISASGGFTAIAGGSGHTLGLRSDGVVSVWGGASGQVPAGVSGVTAVAVWGDYNLALKSDGTVVEWNDLDTPTIDSPLVLRRPTTTLPTGLTTGPAGLSGVTAIARGGSHSLALKIDGTVVAWGGENYFGQTSVPAGLSSVTAIAAGGAHSLALKSNGTVVAWGSLVTIPTGLTGVTAIAAGGTHNLAITFAPTITTTSTSSTLTLFWPDTATGYRVESALSFTSTVIWNNLAGTFQTNGGTISIALPVSGTQKFYRLVKP